MTDKKDKYDIDLPQSIIDSFARFLVPELRKYYESEEGKKTLAEQESDNSDNKL